MTHSVLIIGLGQIGIGYDLAKSSEHYVLSHARAFQQHPSFELVGGVDPIIGRRRVFEKHYSCQSFHDIESAMEAFHPEIVVVSTPTAMHGQTIKTILKSERPSVILCEKPLAHDLKEAREVIDQCVKSKCDLYVNYMRYSEPGVTEIKQRLDDGRIGHPVKGVVWYSKGLFNSGSHFISLLQYLLGKVTATQIYSPGRLWDDLDPEPDYSISFLRGSVNFFAVRAEDFFHNTLELIAPNGRLRYEQAGARIIWQSTTKNVFYADYTSLDTSEDIISSDFSRIQWHVANQLASQLQGQTAYLCSGADAYGTLETLVQIKEKL